MKSLAGVLCCIGIVILIIAAVNHTLPPKPAPANAPSVEFSATRAFVHVQQIGQKPHPIGSPENAKVRQYIIEALDKLGLKPELQVNSIVLPGLNRLEKVNNILVRISGLKPGKALALIAHYDSVANGPGAADDAASVAALLETLQAMKALSPLQNDVIFLFTNGEEINLSGAHAFIEQHPWAKNTGLALNFEYRGNSGAFLMFETSDGNGALIEGLAKAVPFLQTNSLMYEVYKRLPNDTDFSVFKRAKIPGMNFAAIEGLQYYHSPDDRPELLNLGSLQHEGDIMLALVQHFGNHPLDNLVAENRIYFDFPGIGVVHYPANWAYYLAGMLTLMWLALLVSNYRNEAIRLLPVAGVAISFPVLIWLLYVVNRSGWIYLTENIEVNKIKLYFDNPVSYSFLLGFILLNLIILTTVLVYLGKRLTTFELGLGVSFCWLAGGVALGANGASFVLAWPLLGVLTAFWLVRLPVIGNNKNLSAFALFLGSVPGILLLIPLIKNLWVALTAEAMPIIIVLVNLLTGLLLPLVLAINASDRKWMKSKQQSA